MFYAYLILDRLLKLREKIKEDSNNSSIWIDAYKIGILEGNLGLIESFLDPDIEDIHYRTKSKEEVSKRWVDLNSLKDAAIKMAAKKWMRGAQVTHVKMAVLVLEKLKTHPTSLTAKYSDEFMLKTIRKAIKPEARKYGWVQGEKGVKFTKRNE